MELSCDLCCITDIEMDIVLCQISLDVARQMSVKFFVVPGTVQKECPAWLNIFNDLVFVDI